MGLQSMTGHGHAQRIVDGRGCLVELRGVNHRFLDVNIRGAALSGALERSIREIVAASVERGRVDVVVNVLEEDRGTVPLSIDAARVDALWEEYRVTFERCGVPFGDHETRQRALLQILGGLNVVSQPEQPATAGTLWDALVLDALAEAIKQFSQTRILEGERLVADISQRCDQLLSYHGQLCHHAAALPERARDRLERRLARLLSDGSVAEERIVQEAAIVAERTDVTEELVRFAAHLDELKKSLSGNRVGRRLDFIVQELGRETNTIGSKAQDVPIQSLVIDIKGELERIREQVQNLE